MKIIVCAACHTVIGFLTGGENRTYQEIALDHREVCHASEEQYEQAIYDIKFQQITQGIDL